MFMYSQKKNTHISTGCSDVTMLVIVGTVLTDQTILLNGM